MTETNEVLTNDAPQLTRRERQVAELLASGQNNREAAKTMGISIKTVDTHRQHVLKKCRVRNNAELVHYALRREWITLKEI